MKTIFIIISIFVGLTYGQILEINKNEDKQREKTPQLMRGPFLKPLPVFEPPMEPMFPAFRSILDDENQFPSPFDRIHEILNKIPKIIKNDNSFKRWPPLPDRPFFSSISMVSKSDESPFSPLKTVSEVNDEMAKEKQGSGLPVFHPKISSLIDQQNSAPIITIVKGMNPFVSHIQTEQNQEINSSGIDPQMGQLSIRMGFNVEINDNNTSVIANFTDSDLTEPSVPPFKEMINTVVDSFAKFRDLLKHTFSNDRNETKVEDQNKDKTREEIIKPFVVQCDCPQDKHEDNCPNNERNLKDSITIKAQMKTNTEGIDTNRALKKLDKTIDEKKLLADYTADAVITIKELEKSELKVDEKEIKYEWYDYALVATISGTTILLCLLAVLLIMKRCASSKTKVEKKSHMKVETDINNEKNEKLDKEKKIESLVINM